MIALVGYQQACLLWLRANAFRDGRFWYHKGLRVVMGNDVRNFRGPRYTEVHTVYGANWSTVAEVRERCR